MSYVELARTGKIFKPTIQLMSDGFQTAYDYFNGTLFGDLPQCMMTLAVNKKNVLGFFMPFSYVSISGELKHQIAMNPEYLSTRTLEQSLSTLVHEQCHLWVFDVLGRKLANGYHCSQWARKMESIGLMPSDTGLPGGNRTGYRMTHYIVPQGPFARACAELISSGFKLEWSQASRATQACALGIRLDVGSSAATSLKKGKVRYRCPACQNVCWAASNRNLMCGDHKASMVEG